MLFYKKTCTKHSKVYLGFFNLFLLSSLNAQVNRANLEAAINAINKTALGLANSCRSTDASRQSYNGQFTSGTIGQNCSAKANSIGDLRVALYGTNWQQASDGGFKIKDKTKLSADSIYSRIAVLESEIKQLLVIANRTDAQIKALANQGSAALAAQLAEKRAAKSAKVASKPRLEANITATWTKLDTEMNSAGPLCEEKVLDLFHESGDLSSEVQNNASSIGTALGTSCVPVTKKTNVANYLVAYVNAFRLVYGTWNGTALEGGVDVEIATLSTEIQNLESTLYNNPFLAREQARISLWGAKVPATTPPTANPANAAALPGKVVQLANLVKDRGVIAYNKHGYIVSISQRSSDNSATCSNAGTDVTGKPQCFSLLYRLYAGIIDYQNYSKDGKCSGAIANIAACETAPLNYQVPALSSPE